MLRAGGGCLGTGSRRRARQAAIIRGEGHTPIDPRAPEWENPARREPGDPAPEHIGRGEATGGTETSKYPEEKKETSISKVAASEMERAQTVVRAPRGCGLHKVLESIAEQFWEI